MTMIFLCDVHAMYCSVEAVFRPDLRDKPIVVLSNGDGMIVAANKRAKAAGVKKFAPYFQQKKQLEANGVAVFSSNYELYADMSNRLHSILEESQIFTHYHRYSIDEAFAAVENVSQTDEEWIATARQVRRLAWTNTRLPIGCGLGRTFTLAKVASHIGKTFEGYRGIALLTPQNEAKMLPSVPVGEIWGVGRRTAAMLATKGIYNAAELAAMPLKLARQSGSVNLERVVRELNGEQVFNFRSFPDVQSKQEIGSSLSLTVRAETYDELRQALSARVAVAAAKLRTSGLGTRCVQFYVSSGQHAKTYFSRSETVRFVTAIDDTRTLTQAMTNALNNGLFQEGQRYYKIGCRCLELGDIRQTQGDMFAPHQDPRLMTVMDRINSLAGERIVRLGAEGFEAKAKMTRDRLSPAYLTKWADLPIVHCQ
ncbi:Y-family DNA polymerase [Vibrio astriarenae]|uniref:Y-family DNA polymerase n=1 Tax=Vibrio astriarenae TaxID=1481923 RepID=UPI003734EB92